MQFIQQFKKNLHLLLMLLGILVGVVSMALFVHAKDAEMRKSLVAQAKSVDLALDWGSMYENPIIRESKAGAIAETPQLQALRARLAEMCAAYPNCLSIYLMRQNEKKQIYFVVDSSPVDSDVYVQPGVLYTEVGEVNKRVFSQNIITTDGPVKDRWGVWVNAYVPHRLPDQSLIVVGVGVEAKDWNKALLKSTMIPVLATLVFIGLMLLSAKLWQAKAAQNDALMQTNEALTKQAYEDTLTGLPNRQYFEGTLERMIASACNGGAKFAVFYVDLDKSTAVNETMGYAAGDALMSIVARRLSGGLCAEAAVARLSGDQFAVLLSHVEQVSDAELAAQKMINVLASPVQLLDKSHKVAASIGVAVFSDFCKTKRDITMAADAAMVIAKRAGGNQYHVFKQGNLAQ